MDNNKKKKGGCFKTGLILTLVIIAIGFAISTNRSKNNTETKLTESKVDSLSADENLYNALDVILNNLNTEVKIDKLTPQELVALINGSRDAIQRGLNNNLDSIKQKSEIVKSELIKFQSKSYPIIRKKYINELSNRLWENNIEVTCVNKSCTEINVVGGVFASNKNIKEFYVSMSPQLEDLRFKKVNFKWVKHEREFQYYDIISKKDSEF